MVGVRLKMASDSVTVPKFAVGTSYQSWKTKINMWRLVTNVPDNKQGIVVLLESLDGNKKASKAVSDLTAEMLYNANGLDLMLKKLDNVFQWEKVDNCYCAYKQFNDYKIGSNMTISDFILEFEHLNTKLIENGITLPDTMLAFKLLDATRLSEGQKKLALTFASDLKFSSMKSALKRIFSTAPSIIADTIFKQEEGVFYNYSNGQEMSKNHSFNQNNKNWVNLDQKESQATVESNLDSLLSDDELPKTISKVVESFSESMEKQSENEYKNIEAEMSLCDSTSRSPSNAARSSYQQHSAAFRTEPKRFKCEFCSKAFKQNSYLKMHLLTHTKEKPHQCEVCDKRFSQKGNLKTHMKIHLGDKPFACNMCGKRFVQLGNLKSHVKNKHNDQKDLNIKDIIIVNEIKHIAGNEVKGMGNNEIKEDEMEVSTFENQTT